MIEKITIKGTDYTVDEARELWRELNGIFGLKAHDPVFEPQEKWRVVNDEPYSVLPTTPCLWDAIPESEKHKPWMMSCPCPKCSPQYSTGSIKSNIAGTYWQ